jgi:cytochrome c-type biogenesis protein CcmH/NrfF
MRRLSWVAVGLVAVAALAYGTLDDGPARASEDRVQSLARTIRCPQCASQSSADSDTPAARAVRDEIAERIEAGESDSEIRDYFASRFGEEILLTPPAEGVGSLVWVLPVVVTVLAAGGLTWAFVRWRRE